VLAREDEKGEEILNDETNNKWTVLYPGDPMIPLIRRDKKSSSLQEIADSAGQS